MTKQAIYLVRISKGKHQYILGDMPFHPLEIKILYEVGTKQWALLLPTKRHKNKEKGYMMFVGDFNGRTWMLQMVSFTESTRSLWLIEDEGL